MFVGFASLNVQFSFPVLGVNASDLPADSDTNPAYRVYSNAGLIGTGSLGLKDSGAVTGATNASPVVITSVAHGLTTGMKVTTASIGGNNAANRVSTITVLTPDTFSLAGSTGDGNYTTGGTWHVTGLYACTFTPTTGGQYASGHYYDVVTVMSIGGFVAAQVFRFGVL